MTEETAENTPAMTEAEIAEAISEALTEDRRTAFEELGISASSVEDGIRFALTENRFSVEQIANSLDNDIEIIGRRKRMQEEAEEKMRAEQEAQEAEDAAFQRRQERIAVAGLALQGILAGPIPQGSERDRRLEFTDIVRLSVDYADALLATIDQQETTH